MIKNLSGGSIINYGPTLPAANTAFDGTLFYKTIGDDQGLYIFTFSQDSNTTIVGDQPALKWVQAQSPGLHVDSSGVKIGSNLTMETGQLTIFSNNYGVSDSSLAMTFLNDGDTVWRKTQLGGGTEIMRLTAGGVLKIGGNTVWNAGNDQQANAGRLNGQNAAFYQNASNINAGTLNRARLPYFPVHQGGSAGMDNTKEVYIGPNTAGRLLMAIDGATASETWPINIDGRAANASFADSAQAAVSAQTAQTAGTAASAPWTGITGRPTALSAFTNDAGYLSSNNGGFISNVTNIWNKSTDNMNRVLFTTNGGTTFGGPEALAGSANAVGQQAFTTPGTTLFVVPAGVTSISAVTIGGGGGGQAGVTSSSNTYGRGGAGGGLRYATSIAVTPGETLTVVVGAGGAAGTSTSALGQAGGTTTISRGATVLLTATGGAGGTGLSSSASRGGAGSTIVAGQIGGGDGGTSFNNANAAFASGGGGAGGYSGNGGDGGKTGASGNQTTGAIAATAGSGGGGGGGSASPAAAVAAGGGGGVGIMGAGANGAAGVPISTSGAGGGGGGSGGDVGGNGATTALGGAGVAGLFGGGGGGGATSSTMVNGPAKPGGGGAARIIWGSGRAYPATNVVDQPTQSTAPIQIPAFTWLSGTTTIMTVDTAGNLTASGDITAFSDARLKKDVNPITHALDKVLALNGVTFTRIANSTRGVGLIAQNVQAILPEAVVVNEDSMLSVAYGNLAGLFVEAIKELKAEINELKIELSKK